MIDDETRAFIEAGSALLFGTVDSEGRPHATRAWGLQVLDAGAEAVRIVLPGDDPRMVDNLTATRQLAVTAANVVTFRSVQGKGVLTAIEAATAADRRRADRYCDEFFTHVERSDGTPRVLLDRLRPHGYVACTATISEWFDQSPGPEAGAALRPRGRP